MAESNSQVRGYPEDVHRSGSGFHNVFGSKFHQHDQQSSFKSPDQDRAGYPLLPPIDISQIPVTKHNKQHHSTQDPRIPNAISSPQQRRTRSTHDLRGGTYSSHVQDRGPYTDQQQPYSAMESLYGEYFQQDHNDSALRDGLPPHSVKPAPERLPPPAQQTYRGTGPPHPYPIGNVPSQYQQTSPPSTTTSSPRHNFLRSFSPSEPPRSKIHRIPVNSDPPENVLSHRPSLPTLQTSFSSHNSGPQYPPLASADDSNHNPISRIKKLGDLSPKRSGISRRAASSMGNYHPSDYTSPQTGVGNNNELYDRRSPIHGSETTNGGRTIPVPQGQKPLTSKIAPAERAQTFSGRSSDHRQIMQSLSTTSVPSLRANTMTIASSIASPITNRRAASNSSQKTLANMEMTRPPLKGMMIPSSAIVTSSRRNPLVYPAILSKVAEALKLRLQTGDKVKNGLTYKDAFLGSETVDVIAYIIKTTDRNLALLLGRALDAQKFFHDVTYEHRLRDSPFEVYQFRERLMEEDESKVDGVFTLLTECYSPTCTRDHLCYSIACPRRLEQQARLNMKPQPGLRRAESHTSLHGDDEREQKLWIHSVPKEISDGISEQERKRQEVICETIYTERDFVKDLEYLRDFWIKPLRVSNVIPEYRREKFLRSVFGNVLEVHATNLKLAEALTRRQQKAAVVEEIGDIFLERVSRFEPFIRYGANQVYGKYEFEREKSSNSAFTRFVQETERRDESRKLELNGYLTKPTTRLARYPLLLEAVLKHSSEESADKKNIPKAIEIIREFLNRVNIESGRAENKLNLMQLNQSLSFRAGEYMDLKLTDDNRQLIFRGYVKRRYQDTQSDIQVFLFDHCLLIVRVKIVNKREQLKVYRKPIPLELLIMSQSEEISPKNSLTKRSSSSLISSAKSTPSKLEAGNKYPLTFQHLGRRGYEITVYTTTFVGRKKWVEHIENQKQEISLRSRVFTKRILCEKYFEGSNRINCMIPIAGGRKLLFGTDHGLWVSELRTKEGTKPGKPYKVMTAINVTQLDVVEEYSTLLTLCDKSLISWPLDILESPNVDPVANGKRGKKIVGHVNFFESGKCLNKLLVCTVKTSSVTTVQVWEPADPTPRTRKQQAPLRRLLQGTSEGLKVYKEFYIPSETLSISFLKKKVCVGCAKGFEIVSLETLETQSLLDPADTSLDFAMRREGLKPLAIYRLNGEFLLNYSDFSFFVNRDGWRSRPDWIIYWEGMPQAFALSYPYILAFEPSFVEIRHVETAALVHIVTGDNIRFMHEITGEVMYAYEGDDGKEVVASLDFWGANNTS